jgi:hypothetical protein
MTQKRSIVMITTIIITIIIQLVRTMRCREPYRTCTEVCNAP